MQVSRELCSVLYGSLDGRGVWERMDPCICIAESLCYPPETITTLLTSYAAAAAAKSLQLCPTLRDPTDCSPPGSSIHGIFQAPPFMGFSRQLLEWGAIAFTTE